MVAYLARILPNVRIAARDRQRCVGENQTDGTAKLRNRRLTSVRFLLWLRLIDPPFDAVETGMASKTTSRPLPSRCRNAAAIFD
jgi:hypothetical protein